MTSNSAIPTHVAIIPDGNRRWARARGLSVYDGHAAGVGVFEQIARQAAKRHVRHLSLWGMSLDNFTKRSATEVAGLLRIFLEEFKRLAEDKEIHQRKTKINVIGRWREKFPLPVRRAIENAIQATAHYRQYFLNFFLVYNGTDEILEAVRHIISLARRSAKTEVTAALLKQHLFTRELPPVDMVIRTAGEPHLSAGFMMWDVADAELYFTDKFWPDFTADDFDSALASYGRRRRNHGT